MEEGAVIKIIKTNLRENLMKMIYPMNIYSVQHLHDECKETGRWLGKRFSSRQIGHHSNKHFVPRGKVSEVEIVDEEQDEIGIDKL